jgi:hypothetical protein
MANNSILKGNKSESRDSESAVSYDFVPARTILNRWCVSWLAGFLTQVLVFFAAFPAMGESFRFQWDPNAEPDIAGYNLYYGSAPRQYQANLVLGSDICEATACTAQLELDAGHWYVAVTAFDQQGNESDYSEELHVISGNSEPTLIYPNGSITWIRGCTYDILWENFQDSKVTLQLLKDGATVKKIAKGTNNDGAFSWVVSKKVSPGEGYAVRISGKAETDSSDETFRIVAPTVNTPSKGALVEKSTLQSITWLPETFCGPSVDVILLKGSKTVLTIAASAPNIGYYEWEVPEDLKPSSRYRIKIASSSNQGCFGYSEGYFAAQ